LCSAQRWSACSAPSRWLPRHRYLGSRMAESEEKSQTSSQISAPQGGCPDIGACNPGYIS
jgi:hypothetical protein